jgi:hypothetical protein
VIEDSPLAWWRLGEVTGDPIAIDSAGSHDAPYAGAANAAPGLIAGDPDRAFFSSGSNAAMPPDAADINVGGPYSTRTIELWFEWGNVSPNREVLYEEGDATRGLIMYIFEGDIYVGGWNVTKDAGGLNAVLSGIFLDDDPQVSPQWSEDPQGDWVDEGYGRDGFVLAAWDSSGVGPGGSDVVSGLPAGASVRLGQGSRWTWDAATTDVRALRSPDGAGRRAATWYHPTELQASMSFPSPYTGVMRLYMVDWDITAVRRQTVTVDDGSGPQTVVIDESFNQGAWVEFPLTTSTSVSITVTNDGGGNTPWGPFFVSAPVTASKVHHAALVLNGASGVLEGYLDGLSIGSVDGVGDLYGHSGDIGIGKMVEDAVFHDGADVGTKWGFGGTLDEVVIYSQALGDIEVAEHYRAGVGP